MFQLQNHFQIQKKSEVPVHILLEEQEFADHLIYRASDGLLSMDCQEIPVAGISVF